MKINKLWVTLFALIGASAVAQNTFPASGNVGVGTTKPGVTLDVNAGSANVAQVHVSSSGSDAAMSFDNTASGGRNYWWDSGSGGAGVGPGNFTIWDATVNAARLAINPLGYVGIGTTDPQAPLQVQGNIFSNLSGIGSYLIPDYGIANAYTQGLGMNAYFDGTNWILPSDSANSGGALILNSHEYGNITFFTFPSQGSSSQSINNIGSYARMVIANNGYVGIGTTAPSANLEVNGSVKLTRGSGASMTFQDGSVQSYAWTGVLTGGDYAESVDVIGDRTKYEPGDVLVIDPASEGHFLKSTAAYSTSVTGVYSTRPGVVGRRQKTDKTQMKDEVPMAMTGIVPVKVSAENGPVEPGDLLVTASTPGYAMKGTDRAQMLGAVIGKALGHLDEGTGVVEAVVTLQ
jgi:hypothetical protein